MHNDDPTALRRAVAAGTHAATFGFDWEEPLDALDKVAEEVDEVREALVAGEDEAVEEELGDLLFAVCNVARMLGRDPETILSTAVAKFERRFSFVLEHAEASGRDPRDMSLDELEAIWVKSKDEEKREGTKRD